MSTINTSDATPESKTRQSLYRILGEPVTHRWFSQNTTTQLAGLACGSSIGCVYVWYQYFLYGSVRIQIPFMGDCRHAVLSLDCFLRRPVTSSFKKWEDLLVPAMKRPVSRTSTPHFQKASPCQSRLWKLRRGREIL